MEKYFENEFVAFYYDTNLSIQKRIWKEKTKEMSEEQWKAVSEIGIQCLEKFNIKKVLNNTQNFFFAISPELQDWFNKEMFRRWISIGGYKVAIILSSELIAQLSIEQNMDEPIAKNNLVTKYFDNEQMAIDWLIK